MDFCPYSKERHRPYLDNNIWLPCPVVVVDERCSEISHPDICGMYNSDMISSEAEVRIVREGNAVGKAFGSRRSSDGHTRTRRSDENDRE